MYGTQNFALSISLEDSFRGEFDLPTAPEPFRMFVYVEAFPSVEGDGMLSGVMGS